jgi:hypothetical protein
MDICNYGFCDAIANSIVCFSVHKPVIQNNWLIKILAIDEPGGNRNLRININAQHKTRKSNRQ